MAPTQSFSLGNFSPQLHLPFHTPVSLTTLSSRHDQLTAGCGKMRQTLVLICGVGSDFPKFTRLSFSAELLWRDFEDCTSREVHTLHSVTRGCLKLNLWSLVGREPHVHRQMLGNLWEMNLSKERTLYLKEIPTLGVGDRASKRKWERIQEIKKKKTFLFSVLSGRRRPGGIRNK